MHSEVHTITPEKAKQLLALNVSNRRLTQSNVQFLADQLRTGNWKLTHQGIAITESGRLADGQHRLAAIIEADMPAQMMVTTGLDDDAFDVLDIGKARKASDALSIVGAKSATQLAAAVKLAYFYEAFPEKVWNGAKIANSIILDKYREDQLLWDVVTSAASAYVLPNVVVPGPFTCLFFLAHKKGISLLRLRQLGESLKYGASLEMGNPVLAYRNKIAYSSRTTQQARLADYIKLLNAFLSGQSLKIFKAQQYPPMPCIQVR